MAALSVCAEPGCPALIPARDVRCAAHGSRSARRRWGQGAAPPGTTRYLDDRRWRVLSAAVLRERPTCQAPGCQARSREVHHLDGLGLDGPHAYHRANLAALCRRHHSRATARQRRSAA